MPNSFVHSRSGRAEQERTAQRNMAFGLLDAGIVHLIIVGIFLAWNSPDVSKPHHGKAPDKDVTLINPDKLIVENNASMATGRLIAEPLLKFGMPVPVSLNSIISDSEFTPGYSNEDFSPVSVGSEGLTPGNGIGNGDGNQVGNLSENTDEIEPDTFKAVEIMPFPIKQVAPYYPELAQKAGHEGTVWIKCYVDKLGRVRKTIVMKSDSEIFNEPAEQAALQWLFKPAVMNSGPVGTWIAIPFRFKIGH